jgi:hypothetical protein
MPRRLQAQELYEGCLAVRCGSPRRLGQTKQELIDTLWCRLRKRRLRNQAREGSPGEILDKALARKPWKSETQGSIQQSTR